jgi:hypothetical protein
MNRAVHTVLTAMATVLALTAGLGLALAQSIPQVARLTPLQRQQFSRDLVPSNAQDFFKAGQITLEQEVRLLTRPRSPLNENLLKVREGSLPLPTTPVEQPNLLPRDRAK